MLVAVNLPSLVVAVIIVVPILFPYNIPLLSIEAIEVSSELHEIIWLDVLSGLIKALTNKLLFTNTEIFSLPSLITKSSAATFTYNMQDATTKLLSFDNAEMVVEPWDKPLTRP